MKKGPALEGQNGALDAKILDLGYVFSLEALGSLLDFKLDKLAFVQRFVSIHLDRGEVNEDVLSRLALDETIPFGSIEPLDHTLFSSQSCDSS
jgi:hypothetical protein